MGVERFESELFLLDQYEGKKKGRIRSSFGIVAVSIARCFVVSV